MNKQELIDYCNVLKENKSRFINCIDVDRIIDTIKQLDESEKVKVPQCVADWISFVKINGLKFKNTYGFYEEIAPSDDVYRVMYYIFKESIADKKIRKWVVDNIDTFARAWLDGYEVEKEKRYRVKIKNVYHGDLGHAAPFEQFSFYTKERNLSGIRYEFNRKELEEAGFGWVFNCEGVEIEEVE